MRLQGIPPLCIKSFPISSEWMVTGSRMNRRASDRQDSEIEALRQENARLKSELERWRKEGQEQTAREAMYRQAIAAAYGVVYHLDFASNRYFYLDKGIERLIGYTVAETTPELWKRIGSQYQRHGYIASMTAQEAFTGFRAGEIPIWQADYLCRTKQGEVRWIADSSVPLRDEQGKVCGCLGILQDITKRKRVEMALRESEARLSNLLESIRLIAVFLDTEGRITYANDFLLRLLGYTREEILYQNWFDMCLPPEEREIVRTTFLERITEGRIQPEYENQVLTRDQERRLISWSNTVMRNTQGTVIGTASIGVDITDRRRLEAELLQAQKMESIGRLAGGVAHDFNNLLTAILGYTELARASADSAEEMRFCLENIYKAGQRAAELTSQLLGFARKQIISPREVNLNDMILDTDRILRRLIPEHIQLVAVLHAELGRVRLDPGQFQQILMNLVVNARDAMPSGGKITVETDNFRLEPDAPPPPGGIPPGDYVMLTVSDTGEGMREEVMAHIFEPFFTTKGVGKGTGLGLATCYGIVKQNNGAIWAESRVGQGTTFRVCLPRVEDTAPAPIPAPMRAARGSETILLAEDEPMVREIAARTLRDHGYTVLEAADGREAIEIANVTTEPIHLLITDLVMPHIGGGELAWRLQKVVPELRVLYVSGYAEEPAVLEGLHLERAGFLHKPFTAEPLLRKVRELLDE